MGRRQVKRRLKIAFFSLAGLAVGAAFAKVDFPGFRHAVIPIRKGAAKPLYINGEGGRQVLALSMRNLQKSREIEIRMEGASIESWYPPVVTMPYNRGLSVEGGRFSGVEFGKRLPVYVAFNDNGEGRKIEIMDSTDGSLIQSVDVLRGKGNERHNH